jgi:sensor histidine kinase YesM
MRYNVINGGQGIMIPKKSRTEYVVSKELRLSIAVMLLWALLITGFFTYIASGLGEHIGSSYLLFGIIMIGYLAIIVALSIFFSHRILGPFQQLNTELRLIMSGDYHRRLNVRNTDDLSVKSFVNEVNKLLNKYEEMYISRRDVVKHIDTESLGLILAVKEGCNSPEELQNLIIESHKRLKALLEKE